MNTLNLWPQFVVAFFLIAMCLVAIIKHGTEDTTKINARTVIWNSTIAAAILGAGGFWHLP